MALAVVAFTAIASPSGFRCSFQFGRTSPRSRPIGEKIIRWTHTGARSARLFIAPPSAVANGASIGIVTSATGLDPCDIFSAALVTAADERIVAAH
jgi:hypothetical protein